jgi:predicted phage terminase large subunit-like protein
MRPVLTPGGRILATGTPYHEEDLWNYCEDSGGFHVIRYPACDEHYNHILWPERFTEDVLRNIAVEVGNSAFTTQYLCQSASSSGEVFQRDWFTIADKLPRDANNKLQIKELWWVWDTAVSAKTSADYTAGVLGGIANDGKAYIVNAIHGQWEPSQAKAEICKAYMDSVKTFGEAVQGALIEDTKEARVLKSWIDEDKELRSLSMILCSHEGLDKYSRAARIVPKCEAGNVCLLHNGWNEAFINELTRFTADGRHAHDDWVDAFSYLLSRIFGIYQKKTSNNQYLPRAFGVGRGGNRPNFIGN